jgi:hypothetical protein
MVEGIILTSLNHANTQSGQQAVECPHNPIIPGFEPNAHSSSLLLHKKTSKAGSCRHFGGSLSEKEDQNRENGRKFDAREKHFLAV